MLSPVENDEGHQMTEPELLIGYHIIYHLQGMFQFNIPMIHFLSELQMQNGIDVLSIT